MTAAYWLNNNWFGVQVVYAPDAKAWAYVMRKYAPRDMADEPFPAADGHCCTFRNRKDEQEQISVVTIDRETAKKLDMAQVIGLLNHEAMHVWRHAREKIRETEPSAEFEAYAMQAISQFLISVYQKALKKPWAS